MKEWWSVGGREKNETLLAFEVKVQLTPCGSVIGLCCIWGEALPAVACRLPAQKCTGPFVAR